MMKQLAVISEFIVHIHFLKCSLKYSIGNIVGHFVAKEGINCL